MSRYHKPTVEQAENILSDGCGDITVPRLLIDDLVRAVGIIALSGNPLPPEMINGKVETVTGYTAQQHKLCVKQCQAVMNKHDLYEWTCITKEGDKAP